MKRCLFIDESNIVRKVAKRILGGADMLVIEAATGFSGLDICASAMPDFIIVDAALGDISAVEFIRRVCAIEAAHKPRVMICLTEVDIGTIMRAKRAGAEGYLLKPFNRTQLIDCFRHLQSAA